MPDITNQYLEAAIIDQKVAGMFGGKAYAYVAVVKDGYGLGIAVKDESGYNPISGKSFDSYEEAKQWADGLNEHIGLSKDAALDIVGSSMFGRQRAAAR